MAFSAGTFTASALQDSILYFDDLWGNDQVYRNLKKPLPVFNEFAQDQVSMRFADSTPFTDPRNCKNIDVIWLTADSTASTTAVQSGDFCDWTGDEPGSDKKTYTIATGVQTKFSVKDEACKDLFDFQQKVAVALMTHLFILDKKVESDAIAAFVAAGDDMTGLTPDIATYVGDHKVGEDTIWELPTATTFEDAIPYFEMVAQDQFMSNPVHLTGSKWRYEEMVYSKRVGDYSDDRGVLLNTAFPIVRSVLDFDGLATNSGNWMIIDKDAFAYYNLTYYKNDDPMETHETPDRITTMRIASPRHRWYNPLTGSVEPIYYDMRMKVKCTTRHEYTAFFILEHIGGWIQAPKDIESKAQAIEVAFTG